MSVQEISLRQMNTHLELYKRSPDKGAKHKLVVRFIVNRKTYRHPTGFSLTVAEWQREQRIGYPKTSAAFDIEDKVRIILGDMAEFNLKDFRSRMEMPLVSKDAVTLHWYRFIEHRDRLYANGGITYRTRDLDRNVEKKLFAFLEKYPERNDIHNWNHETLDLFQRFMVVTVSTATAKMYLEALRTFFNWAIDNEIIYKNIWKRYRIPKGNSSWFPYSYKEVAMIFRLVPKSEPQKFALRWAKLLLLSGGADPKDFSEMKWWQIQSEAIQFMRVKAAKRSKAGKKLLYLSPVIRALFTEIEQTRAGNEDYILPVYKSGATEEENLEAHKYFMRKINKNMRNMLTDDTGKLLLDFKIKRIRPTAATIANASTKDVNFVSKMLMHSNLEQTSTYLQNMPDDEAIANQKKYEQAIADVLK